MRDAAQLYNSGEKAATDNTKANGCGCETVYGN